MSEIELHRKLLGDAVRNEAFHAALKVAIRPGESTVADLGAGTGFLSFLARRLGAKHCTLVEYSDALDLAVTLARANHIDGLSFVKGHSGALKRPEKVDVVVSETLGNFALEEGLLETLVDARRWLKKGGTLIPCGLTQQVAPVLTPRLRDEIDVWPRVGFGLDLAAARAVSLDNLYVREVTVADLGGSEALARCWDTLDFSPAADAPPSLRRSTQRWTANELAGSTVHGWALWWCAELVPGVALDTAPSAPATHWQQTYLPLPEAVTLAEGEALELELVCDTRPETGLDLVWRTRTLGVGGKPRLRQEQQLSRGRL